MNIVVVSEDPSDAEYLAKISGRDFIRLSNTVDTRPGHTSTIPLDHAVFYFDCFRECSDPYLDLLGTLRRYAEGLDLCREQGVPCMSKSKVYYSDTKYIRPELLENHNGMYIFIKSDNITKESRVIDGLCDIFRVKHIEIRLNDLLLDYEGDEKSSSKFKRTNLMSNRFFDNQPMRSHGDPLHSLFNNRPMDTSSINSHNPSEKNKKFDSLFTQKY